MGGRVPTSLAMVIGGAFAACSAASAGAQAWLPPKGEAWVTLGYGNIYSAHHYLGDPAPGEDPANRLPGPTRSQTVGLAVGYGITERLAVSASLPFVTSAYQGGSPHRVSGVILTPDDGFYHGTFQDYRVNVSYQALRGTVALSPFASIVIPSHDYATLSHAAPGKGLNQVLLGFGVGASLDRIVPGTFAELSYDYAFVEEVIGINTNRSDFGFQAGYFLMPSLALRFMSTGFYTHGGIAYNAPSSLPPEQYLHHDQISKASNLSLGGGLSYQLTGSTDVSVTYLRSVYGRGGHKIDQGLGVSFGWSFSPERIIRGVFPPKPETPAPVSK